MFVCRFVNVASISRISVKAHIEDLREDLLGKPSLVKIGPKVLRSWLDDLGMAHFSLRHYIAIKALSSTKVVSGCLCSRRCINITRTHHNVTCNVHIPLVLNCPVVELVTFVYCFYQHRRSHDWSVFLSPDVVTLDGMPRRRNYTIWLCTHHNRIDVANLKKCCSTTQIFVMVMPKRCSPQKTAYCYRLHTALHSPKNTLAFVSSVKVVNKALYESREIFDRKIFLIMQQIK